MIKFADLHIHTNKSDSTFSPEEVVKYAAKIGLHAIAITDHDSIDAIPVVTKYAAKYDIEIIPGVELSSDTNGEEVHILGYFIDTEAKWFIEKLEFLRQARLKRAQQIIGKLTEMRIVIDLKDVLNTSGEGAIGRMHIARVLVDRNYVSTITDAFQKYIGRGRYAYVKKHKITPKEAMDMIKKLGGISVLAHPGIMNNDAVIPDMVKYGLRGIEVYHTDHKQSGVEKYTEIAKRYNLLITGGSDCHGIGKGRILMGTVKVPYELVERMKEELKRK